MKFPDLEELLVMSSAARTLSLHAHGPARALLLGSYRSTHRGRGLEFEEVRPYVAGDDPRSIDWRVTARRGRLHTKLFREERERPVWLLVDLGPSMFFASRRQLKSMVAVRAGALLAWIAVQNGDRVGAVIGNGATHRVLPARSREAGVLPILSTLVDLQPRSPNEPLSPGTDGILHAVLPLVHPGSLVLALSDFAAVDLNDQAGWSQLAAHSECRWFWITDALEEGGLPNGRFRAGTPTHIGSIDGADIRPRWLAAWQLRAARLTACAQALRIAVTRLDTNSKVEAALQSALHAPPRML